MLNGKTAKGEKSEALIRRALLSLMKKKPLIDISVSELCREAQVSRGTFYLHFNTVTDVYDQLTSVLTHDAESIQSQAVCMNCAANGGEMPFCEMVRNAGDYAPVVDEDRFLESYLQESRRPAEGGIEHVLLDSGYDMQQARAIKAFLSGGCLAAATKIWVSERDWPRIKKTIDCFAAGGMKALVDKDSAR